MGPGRSSGLVGWVGRRPAAAATSMVVAAAAVLSAGAQELVRVLPRDAIPAIDRPVFEPVAAARRMADEELVIGLVGLEHQRAYSTWQLDRHEIVNDTFEGRPIAVTW